MSPQDGFFKYFTHVMFAIYEDHNGDNYPPFVNTFNNIHHSSNFFIPPNNPNSPSSPDNPEDHNNPSMSNTHEFNVHTTPDSPDSQNRQSQIESDSVHSDTMNQSRLIYSSSSPNRVVPVDPPSLGKPYQLIIVSELTKETYNDCLQI